MGREEHFTISKSDVAKKSHPPRGCVQTANVREGLQQEDVLVSIVMPTYNRADILMGAIRSVIRQTYGNWELIIVDDASTDSTAQVVSSFADNRIKYHRLPENSGVSAARNVGIEKARGAFIAFLDSDDEYLPERLEENLKVMDEKGPILGLVCSDFWNIETATGERYLGHNRQVSILWHRPFPSTFMLRKEVFGKIGLFDEAFHVWEDSDFLFRFHIDGTFSFNYIEKPLVCRRHPEDRLTARIHPYIEAGKLFLKKHKNALQKEKRLLAYQLNRMGKDLKRTGDRKGSRQFFLKAFLTYPLGVGSFGKWVKSFF